RMVPFRGLKFKSFDDKNPPSSLFTELDQQSNLDGEALLWAVQRLAARREKLKLMISVSDGRPGCEFSDIPELERHLLTVVRQIEARKSDGLHLFGIGIEEKRVQKFYKNAV